MNPEVAARLKTRIPPELHAAVVEADSLAPALEDPRVASDLILLAVRRRTLDNTRLADSFLRDCAEFAVSPYDAHARELLRLLRADPRPGTRAEAHLKDAFWTFAGHARYDPVIRLGMLVFRQRIGAAVERALVAE